MGLKIGRFLGNIAKAVAPPGVRQIIGVGQQVLRAARGGGSVQQMTLAQVQGPGGTIQGPQIRGPSIQIGGGRGLQIQGPSYIGPQAQVQLGGGQGGMAPKGYHRNKALVRAELNPTPSNLERANQVKNEWVRNRRLNPLNVRALNRGIRRMTGASQTLKTVLRLTGQRHQGRVVPKRRRRK